MAPHCLKNKGQTVWNGITTFLYNFVSLSTFPISSFQIHICILCCSHNTTCPYAWINITYYVYLKIMASLWILWKHWLFFISTWFRREVIDQCTVQVYTRRYGNVGCFSPHIYYTFLVWNKRKPPMFSMQDSNINKMKILRLTTFALMSTEMEKRLQ